MNEDYFRQVALKLQDELATVIKNNQDVNDYEIILYKYMFSKELGIPLWDDLPMEIDVSSFTLYIIPDNLPFNKLRLLDDLFNRFEISFMPNKYDIIRLKFSLSDCDV